MSTEEGGGEAPPEVIEIEAEVPEAPADATAASAELKAAVEGVPAAAPTPVATTATVETSKVEATPTAPSPSRSTTTSTSTSALPLAAARPKRAETEDDEDEEKPRAPKKWPLFAGVAAALVAGITALVLAGKANHRHLYVHCGAKEITALRGRSFPPWGKARLGGPGWKAIAIPPATECTDRSTKDPVELESWYLDALVEQATLALGAEGGNVDVAEAQLQQALLLARSPERRDQRKDIDRLLADVTYARGAAGVQGAIAFLRKAATTFDDAAGRRPRHAADAAAWAAFARSMADRLQAGPKGEPPPTLLGEPDRERPPAPPGVALPVEPDAGFLPPPDVDAGVPGLPSGGVLM